VPSIRGAEGAGDGDGTGGAHAGNVGGLVFGDGFAVWDLEAAGDGGDGGGKAESRKQKAEMRRPGGAD